VTPLSFFRRRGEVSSFLAARSFDSLDVEPSFKFPRVAVGTLPCGRVGR